MIQIDMCITKCMDKISRLREREKERKRERSIVTHFHSEKTINNVHMQTYSISTVQHNAI